jgi:hypothetical protein
LFKVRLNQREGDRTNTITEDLLKAKTKIRELEAKMKKNQVYSCGNCLKLEKELLAKEAGYCRIIQQLSDKIKQLEEKKVV